MCVCVCMLNYNKKLYSHTEDNTTIKTNKIENMKSSGTCCWTQRTCNHKDVLLRGWDEEHKELLLRG